MDRQFAVIGAGSEPHPGAGLPLIGTSVLTLTRDSGRIVVLVCQP